MKQVLIALVGLFCITSAATAMPIETFDTDPVLGSSQAPGVWYTDRFNPAGFSKVNFLGDNRLELSLSAADCAACRPAGFGSAFYNTQGRKFDTPGSTSLMIDFYIDSSYETAGGRIGGLWGTAIDDTDAITAFPIIEFHSDGLAGSFNVWDGSAFQDVGLPTGFVYDAFYSLTIDIVGMTFVYTVNGEVLFIDTDNEGSTEFSNVILQGINTDAGVDRALYFDNFKSGTNDVPEPVTLTLLGAGLAGLGFMRKRKRS